MSNYQSSAGETSCTQTEGWRHSTFTEDRSSSWRPYSHKGSCKQNLHAKYKVDFRIVRILGNKVEVKDNHGKLSFSHISDIKKTDMVTKLICQLPDHDAFGRRGRLSFDPARVKDLGWDVKDQEHKFDPSCCRSPRRKAENSPNAVETQNCK